MELSVFGEERPFHDPSEKGSGIGWLSDPCGAGLVKLVSKCFETSLSPHVNAPNRIRVAM